MFLVFDILEFDVQVNNKIEPSPDNKECYLFTVDPEASVVLVSVQYAIAPERASVWAKTLFEVIRPDRYVLIHPSLRYCSCCGCFSDTVGFCDQMARSLIRESPSFRVYQLSPTIIWGTIEGRVSFIFNNLTSKRFWSGQKVGHVNATRGTFALC